MRILGRRGQSWSMDLVIAVVVFGFIAVVFYSLLVIQQQPTVDELRGRGELIQEKLSTGKSGCGNIGENQTITQTQLECLYNLDVDDLRRQMGVQGKFCIYIEDPDGNVLVVSNSTGALRVSMGDPDLQVSGLNCGGVLPP